MLGADNSRAEASERIEKVSVKYSAADGIKETNFKAITVKRKDFYGRKLLIDHR